MMPASRKPYSWTGLALGFGGIAAVTIVFTRLIRVNAPTVGFTLLVVVLGAATLCGFRASALVSVAAMLCFNFFFLPPVGLFTIADPENWVALSAFLATALVASHLSARATSQAEEARHHQMETERLYALSRLILLSDPSRPLGQQAAQGIAQIFDSPTVMILDGKTNLRFQGGPVEADWLADQLQDVIRRGGHQRDEARDIDLWPISLGGEPVAALAAAGLHMSDGAVQSMLNLVAIALERVRTEEAANRAEAARQSEEFKSTLLDAIAHEFKTPLTSIKAAATGLRALHQTVRPDQEELAAIIEEETDRLSALVTEAVRMAEIDAGKVKPRRGSVPADALVAAARKSFEGRGAERLFTRPSAGVQLMVDSELFTLALRQVLDNALKYSEPGTPVHCEVAQGPERVFIRITDAGPGIPEKDRERIFDKFYRRPRERDQVAGSGMGLHIAREIARIHGGDLYVESGQPTGAVFCFALPAAAEVRA